MKVLLVEDDPKVASHIANGLLGEGHECITVGDGTSGRVIDCGYTSGPKYIFIKKSNNGNSNWFVYDSERGINASGDPVLRLNTTDAEDSAADSVDTHASGFIVNDNNTNANTDTYLFYAIAT